MGCKSEPRPEATAPPSHFDAGGDVGTQQVFPKLASTLYPERFVVTAIRGHGPDPFVRGDSLEGIEAAAAQGVKNVEVDFELTRDGVLVTAHGANIKGTCGDVSKKTVEDLQGCTNHESLRITTLEHVLSHDFDYVFIDLKATMRADDALLDRLADAIVTAAKSERRKATNIIAMMYRSSPRMLAKLADVGVRGGIKGYPKSEAAAMDLVQKAKDSGLEMVCVNYKYVTPAVLGASAEIGVWHLPWALRKAKTRDLQLLARNGAGGLITADYARVLREVAPVAVRYEVRP